MKKSLYRSGVVLMLAATGLMAGEGMWMPQQVPELAAELRERGLKIDPARFSDLTGDPMGAVVSLGGCSASFVSPDGLIVTNHHCAYGAIQYNSTAQRDLLTNGFLAKGREEELPAGASARVFVTTAIEDVTKEINGKAGAKVSDAERQKLIERRQKELVRDCEKSPGIRCKVTSFFEGAQYLRTTQLEIRDVRLVYAPAMGVGNFGGEVDNWMWPRHTGDFSFLRAYVAGDGSSAPFSKENVPFRPKHHLKIAAQGVSPGDLVMVAGYPGRTYRYRTSEEVKSAQEFAQPTFIRYAKDYINLLEKMGKGNREVEIKNASRIKSAANTMKNYEGMLGSFERRDVQAQRRERERNLTAMLTRDPAMNKKYGSALVEMSALTARTNATRERDTVLSWLYRVSPMLAEASKIYRLSIERPKKDLDRKSGYQERDLPVILDATDRVQRSLHVDSDREGLRYFLMEAAQLPKAQRIPPIDALLASTGQSQPAAQVESFLSSLYAKTKLNELDVRRAMLKETTAALDARDDSFLQFVKALLPFELAREERDREIDGAMSRIRPGYLEGLRTLGGGKLYPDANGTLRVTFGNVEGYEPREAVSYLPQTTLDGILQKETGKEPFDSPPALLDAAKQGRTGPYTDAKLKSVPVNFLSTCDTTGGNSGSPTLNAKGELCGLLFDGNYEGLGGDYSVDPRLTRSIHVDARYMLWVMDAVDGAHNLLREMGVPSHFGK